MMNKLAVKVKVKRSKISGKGAFAQENIPRGAYIMTLTGQPYPMDDIKQVCQSMGMRENDPLQVDENTFLVLVPEARIINHSCAPNAGIRNKSDLYAITDINVNDEITYDYSTTVGINDDMSMDCRCGAKDCRKKIGNVLTIPKSKLKQYADLNILPDFIKRQLGLK